MQLFHDKILPLIDSKREGDFWDFKQEHHSNKADLLHDIICMANSLHDMDCYIIFGVENSTGKIFGVENDPNRRNQQCIIDFLRSKEFSGDDRPAIELRTFNYEGHSVDVLIVFDSRKTPYYLAKKYEDIVNGKTKTIQPNAIYTRIGDTNTPIDKSADKNDVEFLWKKRLGLHLTSSQQFKALIQDKEQWDKSEDTHFHKTFSQFTITFGNSEDEEYNPLYKEFYSYVMVNPQTTYDELQVNYYGTRLSSYQTVCLDSGRYFTVIPEWGFISIEQQHYQRVIRYKYFIKGTERYFLHRYLLREYSHEAISALGRFLDVVLVFESEDEQMAFTEYIKDVFDDVTDKIQEETVHKVQRIYEEEPAKSKTAYDLATGIVLVKELEAYRSRL
jgi:hypothetical protein